MDTVKCECGGDVIWCVNSEFPGMDLVLDPEPERLGGVYRVAEAHDGTLWGIRDLDDPEADLHNPHRWSCPLDKPRLATE